MSYNILVLGGSSSNESSLPTLLKSNVVTKGDPNDSKSALSSAKGVDYIIKYIASHISSPKKPGDRVFCIQSGTGSGKSTVIPPELYRKLDARKIVVTEPKRANAITIPQEIAQYNKEFILGVNIGYSTGPQKRLPEEPGIIFMTTGTLLQKLVNSTDDQFIRGFEFILIDEVHLHDVEIDFLLMELKHLLNSNWKNPKCPNVLLMSATLKVQKYQQYFDSPHFIEVSGQSFPIKDIFPENSPSNVYEYAVNMINTHNKPGTPEFGDVLIFMPDAFSMKEINAYLEKSGGPISKYSIMILSGANINAPESQIIRDRSRDVQKNPFIIISTNVAETGVTFPHLRLVIDPGKVLHVVFNPIYNATVIYSGITTQFSIKQRRGRVGRNFEGTWAPAFTEKILSKIVEENFPVIYTDDITKYLLNYLCRVNKIVNIEDVIGDTANKKRKESLVNLEDLDLIHFPALDSIKYSFEKMYVLGLIDFNQYPTLTGFMCQKFNKIPIEAAKMVISSFYHAKNNLNIVDYVISIAAIVSQQRGGIIMRDEWLKTDIAKDANWLIKNIGYDDFIIQLLAFEYFNEEFAKLKNNNKDWVLDDIKEWCDTNNYNYAGLLEVIGFRDEIIVSLLQQGFKIQTYGDGTGKYNANPFDGVPLKDLIKAQYKSLDILETFRVIQLCEIEGYRFNIYEWNSEHNVYQLDYKKSIQADTPPGISARYDAGKYPKKIIQLAMAYRLDKGKMKFSNKFSLVSVLRTDIINLDELFIP
jgi:HrpA-like RNA helicase